MVSLRTLILTLAALFFSTAITAPTSSISIVPSVDSIEERSTAYRCPGGDQKIVKPTQMAKIHQKVDSTTFQVLYCSGAYFKTSSLDATVWLANPGQETKSGIIVVKNQAPDNKNTPAGFYSYLLNVTIYPIEGNYYNGPQSLTIYETTTGYYNAYNYAITSLTVLFVPPNSSSYSS